ncbi:MAG: domain S-box [Acidobacteria bacterium]|nr:domain S-box [Acidobacteriota bacterium]
MLPTAPDPAARLAAIVESSNDAIISKDLEGTITSWNRAAERLFGYTADEVIGRSITLLIPAERLAEEADTLARIRRGEALDHFETVRRRKDGTCVDLSLTISPIRDRNGTIVGASKIARDISAQRATERELAELHRRLIGLATASASILSSPRVEDVVTATMRLATDLFTADAHAIWRADRDGTWRIVRSSGLSDAFASRPIATPRTQSSRELEFSEPVQFEDVATAPMIADLRDAYRAEGIASMIVFPLRIHTRRTGTLVFYFRQRRSFGAVDVQVGAALANVAAAAMSNAELYDEQRAAREAADYARQQAAFLAEAGTALGASLDYTQTLKAVARLAVPTFADWCAVDIVGERGRIQRLAVAHVDPAKVELARVLEERYPADPNAPGGVHHVIRTGEPVMMSKIPADLLDHAARDDEHRRIITALGLTSYVCVPMVAQGRAFGAITFVNAESGREYSSTDLAFAREIAARASLAVENSRAYANANEANRLKDEFLATLSHELRTPLNAVLGYARMLRRGTIGQDKTPAALEVIERNGTALKQIIEDVLDVSRIVSGRLRLDVEPVDLPAVLHEAAAAVMPAADAKGIRVESVIDPKAATIAGDPGRVQQIVWNLLSNAIKFTSRGGKVQLRLVRVNSHVEVVVSDTGQGIDADFLPFVFDRFRQGNATSTREHGGLGLGLAIAKQLAELHGGSMTAASEGSGKGSTFTLKLPVMIVHPAPAVESPVYYPATDRRTVAANGDMPRLDGTYVLAVDDEPDSLDLVRSVLEAVGARVTVARSGAAALEALASECPDVLVADIGMAKMDGLELIRTVRQLPEPMRSLPAAALTAYARSQDRITSLASGFHMHLVKPVDPLELVVAVHSLATNR